MAHDARVRGTGPQRRLEPRPQGGLPRELARFDEAVTEQQEVHLAGRDLRAPDADGVDLDARWRELVEGLGLVGEGGPRGCQIVEPAGDFERVAFARRLADAQRARAGLECRQGQHGGGGGRERLGAGKGWADGGDGEQKRARRGQPGGEDHGHGGEAEDRALQPERHRGGGDPRERRAEPRVAVSPERAPAPGQEPGGQHPASGEAHRPRPLRPPQGHGGDRRGERQPGYPRDEDAEAGQPWRRLPSGRVR